MIGPNSRRSSSSPLLLLALDREAGEPLHRQLYDAVREAVLRGRIAPGGRLPSTRALAADLAVSRNTVVLAFDQLRAEGYIEGRRAAGTRVRDTLPDTLLDIRSSKHRASRGEAAGSAGSSARPSAAGQGAHEQLSRRGAMLARCGAGGLKRVGEPAKPFQLGVPALEVFPKRIWARLTARHWRRGAVVLGEADPAGEPALRSAIASYVANARGVRCETGQVLVVNGAQQALDLLARVLLDPGDAVWLEDPGYAGARMALESAGARLVPLPVDGEGLDVEAGERTEPTARLAYVTPSHQFPLGIVMSAPRRLALLSWAHRMAGWVVEDDYDSEFRYTGRPLLSLQGLDAEHQATTSPTRVLYVGTFSKTLAPGLRLGYLIVPDGLVDAFRAARVAMDVHSGTVAQGVLADFIGEGHYARHLRRVRALYAERQSALLVAAAAELNGVLALEPDPAGMHLIGRLPPGVSDQRAADAAAAEGVIVSPLSAYTFRSTACEDERGALLLNYAGFDAGEIRAAVRQLRRALDSCIGP